MKIQMVGIDFEGADILWRESISFTQKQVLAFLPQFMRKQEVEACALLSTCNRTELYIHTTHAIDAFQLFADVTGIAAETYRARAICRDGEQAIRHIMQVAAGLRSQIFGDDQITTQVRTALDLAYEAGTMDSVLGTLLRDAVSAGKRVKTETRLSGVPVSAASRGVQKAEEFFGSLAGKRAVVIGNGEMGRLAAALLLEAGCSVTVTLRSYRHGVTIVPSGCVTHPYDDRYAVVDGADLIFSATTSPHFTLTAAKIESVTHPPRLIVDLAMPRDVEAKIAQNSRITVWNLDDLGTLDDRKNREQRAQASAVLEDAYADFCSWYAYRQALPVIAKLKDTVVSRVYFDRQYAELEQTRDWDGLIQMTVGKTVDLLLGGMKDIVQPDRLNDCLEHIKKGSGK